MVPKLLKPKAAKAHPQQQPIKSTSPPSSPSRLAKAKAIFFGLGSQKKPDHAKLASPVDTPSVITEAISLLEDETEHARTSPRLAEKADPPETGSVCLPDDSPGTQVELNKSAKTAVEKEAPTVARSKSNSSLKKGVKDKRRSKRKSNADGEKENMDVSRRSTRSTDQEVSVRSRRSTDHHSIDSTFNKESSGGSIRSHRTHGSAAAAADKKLEKAKSLRQQAHELEEFAEQATAQELAKLDEQGEEESKVSEAREVQAANLEQTQQDAAYAIIGLLNACRSLNNKQAAKPVEPVQQKNEAVLLGYIEQLVDPAARGEDTHTVGPPADEKSTATPKSSASKKKGSILKASEEEIPVRPMSLPADIIQQQTTALVQQQEQAAAATTMIITTTKDFSDEVTCLTMDDFEAKTGRPHRRAKRTGRHKPLSQDCEGSASKDTYASASSGGGAGSLSDAGLAEILRKDIHSKKEPVLIAGLDAIKEFAAKGSKQRAKVCAFGAIPSILHILDNHKTKRNVLLSALGALEKVTAKCPPNQETACELGAIPAIASCVQRNLAVKDVVLAACKTLEIITGCMRLNSIEDAEDDKYEDVPTEGSMTVLSCSLMTHSKDKDILAFAVGAITNICMYRPDQVQMLSEAGGITAVTDAVNKKWKSKTRKTQAKADLDMIVES